MKYLTGQQVADLIDLLTQNTLTTDKAAIRLDVIARRVQAMIKQDQNPNRRKTHFPHAKRCPCGTGWLIPAAEVQDHQAK